MRHKPDMLYARLLLYLSRKIAVTKLQRAAEADGERLNVDFLLEIKASEVEEENRPSPTASIARGGFGLPLLLRFLRSLVTRSAILAPHTVSDHTRKFVAISTMML
jgi:hypothetical protein